MMMTLFAALTVLTLSSCKRAIEPMSATVVVDFKQTLGEVPKYLLGQNTEAGDGFGIFSKQHDFNTPRTGSGLWLPVRAQPDDRMVQAAKQVGMSILRFPGGCLTHNYDWKKAIGPVRERPDFTFGIDEFMAYCKAVGAEPLMTIADYVGGPQDAADLVEYLNGFPDDKHPWAKKRAENGHPAPYKVVYFEMGNESDHGNHDVIPRKRFTPEAYVKWFNECVEGMKKIDANIKIGALLATQFPAFDSPWNLTVLKGVTDTADYIIVHTYSVQIMSPDRPVEFDSDKLMRACMASADQFDNYLAQYREGIRQITGKDFPLAITEYNSMFVQQEPILYRFSLGAALFSADYLRVLMQPRSNVLMANYWQFSNGYWGMVRTDLGGFTKMPAYYLYRLWAQHFGKTLIGSQVDSPRVPFEGRVGIVNRAGGSSASDDRVIAEDLMKDAKPVEKSSGECITKTVSPGAFEAEVKGLKTDAHIPLVTVSGSPGVLYRVSFEAKSSESLKNCTLGLSVIDSRGWEPYHSGIAIEGVELARDWKKFSGDYLSLSDAKGAILVWRVLPHDQTSNGKIEIRNLKVAAIAPGAFAGYKAITAAASRSVDGSKVYIVLFNKHTEKPCVARISLKNAKLGSAKYWCVTGPTLSSTNVRSEEVKETVTGAPVSVSGGTLSLNLPPGSMTAIEVTTLPK